MSKEIKLEEDFHIVHYDPKKLRRNYDVIYGYVNDPDKRFNEFNYLFHNTFNYELNAMNFMTAHKIFSLMQEYEKDHDKSNFYNDVNEILKASGYKTDLIDKVHYYCPYLPKSMETT